MPGKVHQLLLWSLCAIAVLVGSGCEEKAAAPDPDPHFAEVAIIAPLIDPAKLDTLKGDRAANRRLRKIAHHLETARREGSPPEDVIDAAQAHLGTAGSNRGDAVKASLLRNLDILRKLGCFGDAGMGKLRTGNAPLVTLGPYAGDIASVDHIIPRSVCEELDERLYNIARNLLFGMGRLREALKG